MFKSAKSIYFSLASLGGLLLIVVGLIGIIQFGIAFLLGTRTFTLPTEEPPHFEAYVSNVEKIEDLNSSRDALIKWEKEYNEWLNIKRQAVLDESYRREQLGFNLAALIVGVPIFLYHIRYVKREVNNNNKDENA